MNYRRYILRLKRPLKNVPPLAETRALKITSYKGYASVVPCLKCLLLPHSQIASVPRPKRSVPPPSKIANSGIPTDENIANVHHDPSSNMFELL